MQARVIYLNITPAFGMKNMIHFKSGFDKNRVSY